MKSLNSNFTAKVVGLYALVAIFTSCGQQPGFLAPPAKSDPAVRLADEKEVTTGDVVKNSYIVTFRGENTPESVYFSSFHDEYQHHFLRLQDEVFNDPRVKDLDILTTLDLSRRQSSEWAADFTVPDALRLFWDEHDENVVTGVMSKVNFASPEDAKSALDEWANKGLIWFAEPNGISRLSADATWDGYHTAYSKDPQIWWHSVIKLPDAFASISKVNPSMTDIAANPPIVAVLDSGTDYENTALKENIWNNTQPGASGCANDVHGCDTTKPEKGSLGNGNVWPVGADGPAPSDYPDEAKGGHGTHVAGIIAAKMDGNIGGVCPVCKVMIVKVADSGEKGDTNADPKIRDDSQIRGFKYITRFKKSNTSAVRVANSSFGKYSRSKSISILVDALKKIGNGTIVIAAASNEDSMIRSYPAALGGVVAVSALREDLQKASYSNFGPWVSIAAPGGKGTGDTGPQINSTWPGANGSKGSSGTSMAAPVVAGAAGLFLAVFPGTDFATLRSRIIDTADGSIYTGDSSGAKFNAQYYFPKLSGEDARRPLLGSGVLDVDAMINNSKKGAIGKPLDRVSPGCATVGLSATAPHSFLFLILFSAAPLLAAILRSRD